MRPYSLQTFKTLSVTPLKTRQTQVAKLQHRSCSCSRVLASSTQNIADIEPGTPEAPPQVPTSFDTVPGTQVPVEEVVLAGSESGGSASESAVARESGSGDLAGADGAAVADIAATVQPLMDTVGGAATATEAQLFQQNMGALVSWMRTAGFFNFASEGPEVTENGAMKKACVEVGRSRPEIIFDIERSLLKQWIGGYENPRDNGADAASLGDRKAINAKKRLESFAGLSGPVALGEGSVSFVDVMRILFAMHIDTQKPERVASLKQEFLMDSAAIASASLENLQKEVSLQSQAQYAEMEANQAAEHERIAERRKSRSTERGFNAARGGEGSQNNFRPGDWECESCGYHNFAKNSVCNKCSAERPASAGAADGQFAPRQAQRSPWYAGERSTPQYNGEGLQNLPPNFKQGDWMCPGCNAHNFQSKMTCYRCSEPRPSDSFTASGRTAATPPSARPGDWICGECSANNFSRRDDCYKCHAPRTASSEVVPGERNFGGNRFGRSEGSSRGGFDRRPERAERTVRAGDWKCSDCKAHNFARNSECFKCGASAAGGEPMTPTESGSGSSYGGQRRSSSDRYGDSGNRFSSPSSPRYERRAKEAPADLEW